jgi:hypothetical protein
MTRFQFFRKWIVFLQKARPATDLLGLIAALGLFFYYAPIDILNSNPATGGDTGSHFWPLVTLVKEGLPNWHIRVWNPGNLGGEPHLTHYFPFPYLLMALLSAFMPLGRAFNIGTILPLILFPLCVYGCFRGLKTRFPIPILAALFSLSFLYNESFSMWGGNTLSTLAGQFAHVYAYDFLLLGIGALYWQMDRRQFPWWALFLFTGVLLSHFYVALFLPAVIISFLFFHPAGNLKERFRHLFWVGAGANLLSAWFVIPMLHNAKWNTAFGLRWAGAQLFQEALPQVLWPIAGFTLFFGALSILGSWKRKWPEQEWRLLPFLLFFISFCGVVFFYFFPDWGLVDVRVIPTVQLALCFALALFTGLSLKRYLSSVWTWYITVLLIAVCIWWPARQVRNFAYWMKWNYSSWNEKESYPDLQNISEDLKGDFSQPRVIYENSQRSNSAGTMRVFEMLPYFAGRATLESVYMQATILAPETFYLQALISKSPSCPFPNYQCTSFNLQKIPDYLQLLGVSQLILVTDDVVAQADKVPFLEHQKDYGFWHLYNSKLAAPLVEVLEKPPGFLKTRDFKHEFYDWFLSYQKGQSFLIDAKPEEHEKILSSIHSGKDCHPQVKVDFDVINLQTDCPNQFHILKFAYHSTFKASTGDRLYLTSPGFIGIIPSQNRVSIRWGQHWLWNLADLISWITLIVCVGLIFRSRFAKRGER